MTYHVLLDAGIPGYCTVLARVGELTHSEHFPAAPVGLSSIRLRAGQAYRYMMNESRNLGSVREHLGIQMSDGIEFCVTDGKLLRVVIPT